MNKKICYGSLSEFLTPKEMKNVLGGSGDWGLGTCGWSGAGSEPPLCGISKQAAMTLQSWYGGYWCCDSCGSTDYCG